MADHDPARRSGLRDPRLQALAEESGYEIHERIGAGGMGIVYRADDADGRDVAIKLLRAEIADDPRARDRLAREVRAQQRVTTEGIARILDAELDSAEAFVVTEFIPGPTLEDAVRRHSGLHPEVVREIGLALGNALHDIHDAGIVHRDLKPSNILLRHAREEDLAGYDPDGDRLDPVIIDFGIAQAAEESRLTSTGLVMGTAAYLDPEVVRTNLTSSPADWWAWAALVAFAATGREPFGSGRADVVFLRAERGEVDVEGMPTELAAWVRDALRPEVADRAAPEDLLARLAELDLDIYDDPGQTEALAAGSFAADDPGETQVLPTMTESDRTEALPAHGAAAAGATVPLAAGSSAAAPVHDLEADDRGVDDGETDDRGAEDLDRTQALPALGENDTRALPASPPSEPSEPATEVLQPVQDRTSVLPVVRDPRDPGAHQHPFQHAPQQQAPQQYAPEQHAPQQYAPEQYAPHQQAGAPGQFHHGYPLAPPPPRRTLLVLLGHAILIGLAAVAPYIALTLLLLLGGASRTWEQSHQALQVRRGRGAGGAGATWMVGLAWPFRFVLNVLQVALVALFPLILGLLLAFSIDAVLFYLGGGTPLPTGAMTAIAMGITVLLTWFGIGGRTLRAGAHRALAAATPDRVWTLLMALLLLGLLAAVIITVLARSVEIDYFPFWTGPRVEDIAFWRR